MGKFEFVKTKIEGLFIIDVGKFDDDRGYFMESYNKRDFDAAGLRYEFVQDNQSSSKRGVLRGLHFQTQKPQAKLVRVLEGEVFDVAVDLRKGSLTYGQWEGVVLSADNRRQFMIPRGFAHGFQVMSDTAVFAYKCDDFYDPGGEGGILWSDPELGIEWPLPDETIVSDKDEKHPTLKESKVML